MKIVCRIFYNIKEKRYVRIIEIAVGALEGPSNVVGGVLVVATAYGTCSLIPQTVSEVSVEPAVEVTTATPGVPVSEVTPVTTEDASNTETTTTGE